MSDVKAGDTVKIAYVAMLKDGTVFDSSPEGEPFVFTFGDGEILPELAKAVQEMEIGETTTVILPPEKGYGKYDESLVIPIPKESLPEDFEVIVGEDFVYETKDHRLMRVNVSGEDDVNLYFDQNDPLAGKTLKYEITLLEINSAK